MITLSTFFKQQIAASVLISTALLAAFSIGTGEGSETVPEKHTAAITIEDQGGKLRIESGGRLLAVYNYQDVPRPYFYPVIGPAGQNMTRHWPMSEEGRHEEHDHPHHTGLYFTHGEANHHDFWLDVEGAGKIVHDGFDNIQSDEAAGSFESANRWVSAAGELICRDRRVHRLGNIDDATYIDYEVTLIASEGPVLLGDTKEGTMAIRLPATMRVEGEVGQGHIVNSEGIRDAATWGKRAKWVDYYGPLDNEIVGVAIFDHPQNPRHPTWWHVRTYGLFAANPFGLHHFENMPKGGGDLTIGEGESLTFRYRFYFHRGDEKEGSVAQQYERYAAEK